MTRSRNVEPLPSSPMRVFWTTALAGPPAGGLAMLVWLGLLGLADGAHMAVVHLLAMSPLVIIASYAAGGAQAIVAAAAVAVMSRPEGRFSYRQAVAAALIAGAAAGFFHMSYFSYDQFGTAVMLVVVGCIAACAVRAAFFRRFSPPRHGHAEAVTEGTAP